MTNRGLLWLFNETLSFKMIPPPMDYEGFGKALLVCANGDGRITAAERAWVIGFLDAYGAPDGVLDMLKTYDGKDDITKILASSPTVKMSATSALYDAIRACAADDELHEGEKAALEKMAALMGIDTAKINALVELYYEEKSLKAKRLGLIFPNGIPFQG